MNKISIWIGIVTGIIVLGGSVFWGVPSYIQVQVRNQVEIELAKNDVSAAKAMAEQNKAALTSFGTQLDSMEARMIARDEWLMNYLERQAQ